MLDDLHAQAAAAGVQSVEFALSADTDAATLVAALDRAAEAIVAVDLAHRMIPHAERLAELDVRDHPWAGLLVGIAVCAMTRDQGLAILEQALAEFEDRADERGVGHASLLIGNERIAAGDFEAADTLWKRAREVLADASPAELLAAAHGSLTLYQAGNLVEAQRAAESAAQRARMAGNAHAEGAAAVYLAFFSWWRGDFRRVDRVAAEAEAALNRIPDEANRYEIPLVHAARACVAALRGQSATTEFEFDAALCSARSMHNDWYEAILLILRAEFAAEWQPVRSIADARNGLAYFDAIGETWWSHWALQAAAIAHRVAGHFHAGAEIIDGLLETELNPLERGRALLNRGDILAASLEYDGARTAYLQARELLDASGADYWTSRSEIGLAVTDSKHASAWHHAAIRRAGTQYVDPAWSRALRGPASIHLQLIGTPQVVVDGTPVKFSTRAALRVVARLAVASPAGVHAETILEEHWPTQSPARTRHSLDNLWNQIRKALNPALRLERRGQLLRLDLDPEECDVLQLLARTRELLAGPLEPQDAAELRSIATQLEGDFLGGGYEDWIVDVQHVLEATRDRIARALAGVDEIPTPDRTRRPVSEPR